ncbi:MAG: hypothetical protein ACXWQO_10820 [Bdellovibrionota bacterium]
MKSLLLSILIVATGLLAPIPFVKNLRVRKSLAIMSVVTLGLGALSFVLAEERGPALSAVTYIALIGLFWVAGRFEAK